MRKGYIFGLALSALFTLSTTAGFAQWVHTNGPYGGGANDIAISGSDIFVAAGTVYISENGGVSWTATNGSANSIVANGKSIFAATGGEGVFRSTDNGLTWSPVNQGLPTTQPLVTSIMAAGGNVYAVIASNVVLAPGYGIYRSTDNGANWTASNNGLTTTSINALDSFQTSNGSTDILAATTEGAFLSSDGGNSWSAIGPANTSVYALAGTGNSGGGETIFAGTNQGIYKSTDNGGEWTRADYGLTDTLVSALTTVSTTSGGVDIFAGTRGGNVFVSSDNGGTWNIEDTGLLTGTWETGASIRSFSVAELSNSTGIFACTTAGVFLTTDAGNDWKYSMNGICSTEVSAFAAVSDAAGGQTLLAGSFPSGIFLSTDGGSNWNIAATGVNSVGINAFTVSGKTIFAGGWLGVLCSSDFGASWKPVGLAATGEVVSLLSAAEPNGDTLILAGTWDGLFISSDNGSTWDTTGLNEDVQAIAADSDGQGSMNIFAGTRGSGVFLSTDEGATWSSLHNGIPQIENINDLFFSGKDLFASTDNSLYVSTDNGTSWAATGLNTYTISSNTSLSCVVIDTNATDRSDFFAGTNDHGVLVSTDGGATWAAANTGLTDSCVYSLAVVGPYLFAGTNLSGIWRRPLSELTGIRGLPPGKVPQVFSLDQNYPNPFNPTTRIRYEVPSPQRVTIKVYDDLGREVTTLVDGFKPAGTYEVEFNAGGLASGVYFYRIQTAKISNTKKMIYMK